MERVPWQYIAAVIPDCFDGGQRTKRQTLSSRKLSNAVGHDEAKDVKEETFEPMSINGAKGVRDIQTVMLRVYNP